MPRIPNMPVQRVDFSASSHQVALTTELCEQDIGLFASRHAASASALKHDPALRTLSYVSVG